MWSDVKLGVTLSDSRFSSPPLFYFRMLYMRGKQCFSHLIMMLMLMLVAVFKDILIRSVLYDSYRQYTVLFWSSRSLSLSFIKPFIHFVPSSLVPPAPGGEWASTLCQSNSWWDSLSSSRILDFSFLRMTELKDSRIERGEDCLMLVSFIQITFGTHMMNTTHDTRHDRLPHHRDSNVCVVYVWSIR